MSDRMVQNRSNTNERKKTQIFTNWWMCLIKQMAQRCYFSGLSHLWWCLILAWVLLTAVYALLCKKTGIHWAAELSQRSWEWKCAANPPAVSPRAPLAACCDSEVRATSRMLPWEWNPTHLSQKPGGKCVQFSDNTAQLAKRAIHVCYHLVVK